MRVAMFSNTYLPFVGGLTMSVSSYAASMRSRGHEVLVVVPEFEGQPEEETGVLRVPAIKHFANTRFSIPLFVYPQLSAALDAFAPNLLHAHHPYLLGDTALREASLRGLPLVVTHHTHALLYEHNLPEGLKWLAKFLDGLSTGFANLCDAVIAPSEGVRRELEAAGVDRPIHVIPNGAGRSAVRPRRWCRLPRGAPHSPGRLCDRACGAAGAGEESGFSVAGGAWRSGPYPRGARPHRGNRRHGRGASRTGRGITARQPGLLCRGVHWSGPYQRVSRDGRVRIRQL